MSLDYTRLNKFKITLAVSCAVFFALFLLLFQPFGVNNYRPDEKIEWPFVIGVSVFSASLFFIIIFMEFVVKPRLWRDQVYIFWLLIELLAIGSFLFIIYNWLGNFHDFSWTSYGRHILQNTALLLFPFSGVHFYFQHKKVRQEYHKLAAVQDQDDFIHLQGDYKKDAISLPKSSIVCIFSEDNYVALYYLVNDELKKILMRSTLKSFQSKLDFSSIVRCNRSTLLNIDYLHSVKKDGNSLILQVQHLPHTISVSKGKADVVMEIINARKTIHP